jgi:hypothetical protein
MMKLFNLVTAPYYSYGPVAPSSQSGSAGDGVHGDPIDKALATADVPARLRRPLIGHLDPSHPGCGAHVPRVACLPQPQSFWA